MKEKEIKQRLNHIHIKKNALKSVIEKSLEERASLDREEKQLNTLLRNMNRQVSVSDHAVVRYLERVHGFDIEKIKQEILTPERVGFIKAGAKKIHVSNMEMRVENGVVVTVI
jgi:SOS response regulatory protein OraA/RecX